MARNVAQQRFFTTLEQSHGLTDQAYWRDRQILKRRREALDEQIAKMDRGMRYPRAFLTRRLQQAFGDSTSPESTARVFLHHKFEDRAHVYAVCTNDYRREVHNDWQWDWGLHEGLFWRTWIVAAVSLGNVVLPTPGEIIEVHPNSMAAYQLAPIAHTWIERDLAGFREGLKVRLLMPMPGEVNGRRTHGFSFVRIMDDWQMWKAITSTGVQDENYWAALTEEVKQTATEFLKG